MKLLTLGSLLGCLVAALIGWRLGGREGAGVVSGFLLAASLGTASAQLQRLVARTRPEKVMAVHTITFLLKLGAALVFTLIFRFIEQAGSVIDWRAFLVTFGATSAVYLVLGTTEAAAVLKKREAH